MKGFKLIGCHVNRGFLLLEAMIPVFLLIINAIC